MLTQEVAGASTVLTRLEKIRELNAKREWINRDLYRLTSKMDMLVVAYERLKSQPGNMTPGSDDQTLDGLSMSTLKKLSERLQTEQYQPKPVRTTYIPKANGKLRKLGIPNPRDKIVQEVIRDILEAVYESPKGAYFSDNSHGFRRAHSCHTALRQIQQEWTGVTWIIEGDIKQCFDDVHHDILIEILSKKIEDDRFLNLVRKFLKAGYFDAREGYRHSLAGTPQGGITSPILANIYLNELDEYVEKLKVEYEKGQQRKLSPKYRSLQRRRIRLAREGKAATQEYKALTREMRKLPSGDPQDPEFVRIKYVRYADDWVVGVIGPKKLAEEIKEKIGEFLKNHLDLTLSADKTRITHAKDEAAEFLGYKFRVGRTHRDQKITKSTNGSGRTFSRRATGMEIVIMAPMEKVMKRLSQKGFCDKNGKPTPKKGWTFLDEDQIINLYSSVNRGLLQFYRPVDNWGELTRLQYVLKYSLAKTLATKRKTSMARVLRKNGITIRIERKGTIKEISFYENTDWQVDRSAFSQKEDIDLVRMAHRLRTRSKLGLACCICGKDKTVEMHHVRHIRKMSDKRVQGFTRIMAILNRKQIPVCKACHLRIHRGSYDGLKLGDLAYDPRKPQGL